MNHSINKSASNLGGRVPPLNVLDRAVFHVILPCVVGVTIGLLMLVSPWLALVCTLVVSIVIVVLIKPILLCYLVIMGVALTSGMERGKLVPYLRANEVILAFSLAIAFVIIFTKKNRFPVNLDRLGIAIFVLITGTSIIPGSYYLVRGSGLTIQDAIVLMSSYQYVLLLGMFVYIPNNNRERLGIIKVMLFCSAIVAVVGLLQAQRVGFVLDFLSNWYASNHQAVALRENRITSLLGSWNGLGIFMMFNLMILWTFGVSRPSDLGWRTILIEGGVFIACLLLSGSFAGMAGLFLGITLIAALLGLFINKRNILLFFLMAIVFVITFAFFSEKLLGRFNEQFGYGGLVPATLVDRLGIWKDVYLPIIQKNIFWGINPTISSNYAWQYTESQYLDLLFSFGLVGLISYILWNAITLNSLFRKFNQHGSFLRMISAIDIAIVIVLLIAGFSNAVFTYSGTADYLWIMLALVATDEGVRKEVDVL